MTRTLRSRVLLGYGIVLALLVCVVGAAIASLRALGNASAAILTENYRSILAAEKMTDALGRQDSAELMLLLGLTEDGLAQFRRNEKEFFEWLARAKDNVTVEGEDEVVAEIDSTYTAYLEEFSHLRDAIARDGSAAEAYYQRAVVPALDAVRQACDQLHAINQRTMFAASERTAGLAGGTLWTIAVIGGLAVSFGVASSLLLSHLLVRPLRELTEATKKVAAGDYDVEVRKTRSDEVSQLASEFNVMAERLKSYRDMNMELLIGEQRRNEAVIRSIDDGILVVDKDLRVSHLNPLAADVFGTDPQRAQGRHVLETIRDARLFELIKGAADSGRAPEIPEGKSTLTTLRGGKRRHYLFSIVPVPGQGSRIYGVLLVMRDVTRLKELDELRSAFVMTASHQLRTPLTSIGMSIGLLTESAAQKLTDRERQLLATAHEETQRLAALVTDLLDLSKIEAGRLELEFTAVSVKELFDRTLSVLKAQADEKGMSLTAEVRGEFPQVKADASKIAWVLSNLVSNALRYTASGGHVRLRAEAARGQAYLSVSDDGAGIPYEDQSRIFEKFAQVKKDGGSGGTGLGLAISREIVRAHGGAIWVESTPGEGSTFTFALPLAEDLGNAPEGDTP